MTRALGFVFTLYLLLAGCAAPALAQEKTENYTRQRDVIYGRKSGLALTMDVFTPKKPNGYGIIFVVSGGWFSGPQAIAPPMYAKFLERGYTVFAVVHGSQPKYTLPEIMEDMHRSVRFIRHHAKKFGIDPEHIGVTGGSAGGHLSLMLGTAGTTGKPSFDPVDRASSQVQAVACFFPPTDFLNWSKPGHDMADRQLQPPFTAAIDYHEFDSKKALYQRITDKKKLREIARAVSPISHVSKTSAPALIIHGDKDTLVPIYQAERMVEAYKEAGVEAKLVVRKGAGHGWPTLLDDTGLFADWFDRHLRKIETKPAD
ncbi:MAG: alpha/beta hydrolase [Gemmataceae bacterium]